MIIDYQTTILELLEEYKDNSVVLDIKLAADDGGKTIDIIVNTAEFKTDIFPRKRNNISICVVKKYFIAPKIKA